MNMILEYLLAGIAAVSLIVSAVFAALAELPTWAAYVWAIAVLLAPVGYLLVRKIPPLEFPVERLARFERERGDR